MKREGRQRGMVKTHPIVADPWNQHGLGSAPTAGQFTKVSTKPTNHSKFTSKCGRPMCRKCRSSPISKSKDKAKGALRLRSSSDVVDGAPGVRVPGFSGTSVLDYLDCDHRCYGDDDDDDEEEDNEIDGGDDNEVMVECDQAKNNEIDGGDDNEDEIEEMVECEAKKKNGIDGGDHDNEDNELSFCGVGLFWQVVNGDKDLPNVTSLNSTNTI